MKQSNKMNNELEYENYNLNRLNTSFESAKHYSSHQPYGVNYTT